MIERVRAAWARVWASRTFRVCAVIVALTVANDFRAWQSDSAAVRYAQHLIEPIWPLVQPAISSLAGG